MVILKTINGTKVERLKKLRNSTNYEICVVETMTRTHFSCWLLVVSCWDSLPVPIIRDWLSEK